MTSKLRNHSVKFPCGTCKTECKDGTIPCLKCGTWFHGNACSGVPTNQMSNLESLQSLGVFWMCKSCVEIGKRILRDPTQSDKIATELSKKLISMEKKLNDDQEKITKMIEQKFEEKFNQIEEKFDSKFKAVIEQQGRLPTEIKSAWSKQPEMKPQKIRVIMQETLAKQEREKVEQEQRENNIILFRVEESTEVKADDRVQEDKNFVDEFCQEGLLLVDNEVTIKNVIRLGPKPTKEKPNPRPLKVILEDKTDKIQIFRRLRHLPEADKKFKSISVSHDYSAESRRIIKEKIKEAKAIDGDDAKDFVYLVRGSASDIRIQKKRKKAKVRGTEENEEADIESKK